MIVRVAMQIECVTGVAKRPRVVVAEPISDAMVTPCCCGSPGYSMRAEGLGQARAWLAE